MLLSYYHGYPLFAHVVTLACIVNTPHNGINQAYTNRLKYIKHSGTKRTKSVLAQMTFPLLLISYFVNSLAPSLNFLHWKTANTTKRVVPKVSERVKLFWAYYKSPLGYSSYHNTGGDWLFIFHIENCTSNWNVLRCGHLLVTPGYKTNLVCRTNLVVLFKEELEFAFLFYPQKAIWRIWAVCTYFSLKQIHQRQ